MHCLAVSAWSLLLIEGMIPQVTVAEATTVAQIKVNEFMMHS